MLLLTIVSISAPCLSADLLPFRIVTGDLPPFALEHGEQAPGALTEVAQTIAKRAGVNITAEFVPWQRAILMPTKLSRVAVFPLTRTTDRDAQYRWLVKLYRQNFIFMGRAGGADVQKLETLRSLKIAVLHGSPHLKILQDEHFTHIVEVEDVRNCIRMLHAGMVDAVYGGEAIHRSASKEAGYADADFSYGISLQSGDIWLAGSMDFSEEDAARLQHALHTMIADGSYARILAKYGLPASGFLASR